MIARTPEDRVKELCRQLEGRPEVLSFLPDISTYERSVESVKQTDDRTDDESIVLVRFKSLESFSVEFVTQMKVSDRQKASHHV